MIWPESKVIYGHSAKHTLKKVSEGSYVCEDSYYSRYIGYPEKIEAIDFDGGPMISIGTIIDGLGEVIHISPKGVIQFKQCT